MMSGFRPVQLVARRLAIVLAVSMLVLSLFESLSIAALATVHEVRVASVNDVSFVVTWTTDAASAGLVRYGVTKALELGTVPDLNPTATTAHYVTISGLNPSTTYYFDVISGGQTDDNGGAHYAATTGPTLSVEPGTLVFGQVFAAGGVTPLDNVTVYLRVRRTSGDSQTAALRTSSGGYWGYSLGNLRTANYQTVFSPQVGEIIEVTAEGGSAGSASFTAPVPAESGSIGNLTLTPSDNTAGWIYLPLVIG